MLTSANLLIVLNFVALRQTALRRSNRIASAHQARQETVQLHKASVVDDERAAAFAARSDRHPGTQFLSEFLLQPQNIAVGNTPRPLRPVLIVTRVPSF